MAGFKGITEGGGNWNTIYGEDSEPLHTQSVVFLPLRERKNDERETKSLLAQGTADEISRLPGHPLRETESFRNNVPEAKARCCKPVT